MHHSVHSMLLRLALTAGTLLVLWAFGEPIGEAATVAQICPTPTELAVRFAESVDRSSASTATRARQRRLTLTLPFAVNLSPVNAGDAERI